MTWYNTNTDKDVKNFLQHLTTTNSSDMEDEEKDKIKIKINYLETLKTLKYNIPEECTEEKASELFHRLLVDNDLDDNIMLKICGMKILSEGHLDQRIPHEAFKDLLDFENRAIALNSKLAHLKT